MNAAVALERIEPVLLGKELQRLYLMSKINKIKGSVMPNSLTMQDIVNEVNAVRKEQYEKQNCI